VAKLGILVLIVIACLAVYLGRAVGVASCRRGYNEGQAATEQLTVEDLIIRWCITAHLLGHDARGAAEMSVARPLTEEEWENSRAVWEHVFDAVKRNRESLLSDTPSPARG
jgi:hypothetical protein